MEQPFEDGGGHHVVTKDSPRLSHRPVRVHPRACGGNAASHSAEPCSQGPSPRVRGKLPPVPVRLMRLGSIPARAGETTLIANRLGVETVHPRACGGNSRYSSNLLMGRGPSPRVRGKPSTRVRRGRRHGSIPARAGETFSRSRPPPATTVHPRACGGNAVCHWFPAAKGGPSPRVRGKQHLPAVGGLRAGSIPARAGETLPASGCPTSDGVHPRACGGN